MTQSDAIRVIRDNLRRWTESGKARDALVERLGDCRFALIGEASHGTQAFYRTWAQITTRLIEDVQRIAWSAAGNHLRGQLQPFLWMGPVR